MVTKMIFIDTGAFIAKYIKNDQHHTEATLKWKQIGEEKFYTSNHIIDETITLLSRKTNNLFALDKGKRILASPLFTILRSDLNDELIALKYFEKFADKKISFTDCLSISLMERYRINKIFTFDDHFKFHPKVELI